MALSGPNASSYLTNNMLLLPYIVQITNGSGAQMANVTYGYDGSSIWKFRRNRATRFKSTSRDISGKQYIDFPLVEFGHSSLPKRAHRWNKFQRNQHEIIFRYGNGADFVRLL